jgi:hypothetical protein
VVNRSAFLAGGPPIRSVGGGGNGPARTGYLVGMAFQVTEVQKALKGANYPMDGDQLADLAQRNGADDELVAALRGMREVEGPNGVMKNLKGNLGGSTGD